MTTELIEKFIEPGKRKNKLVRIQFKLREPLLGVFVFGKDYEEMKRKNFWRIVTESKKAEWLKTNDMSCTRLFSGLEFTRLADSE